MDKVTLELHKRDVTGKTVKRLRAEGIIPAVIHDHGKESLVVQAEYQAIYKAYQQAGKHQPIELTADGKKYTAMVKKVTYDPRYNSMDHIVFAAIKANEKVTTDIPVHITFAEGNDTTPAERAGLVVLHQLESVEVEAIATKLPDALTFDGEKLVEVGDHVTVADLTVPEGVTIKTEPNQTLATVFEPSALQAANDAAGGDVEEEAPAVEGEEGAEGEATEGAEKAPEAAAKPEEKKS